MDDIFCMDWSIQDHECCLLEIIGSMLRSGLRLRLPGEVDEEQADSWRRSWGKSLAGWAQANWPSLRFTDQGCCVNTPTSIYVQVSSGKDVVTHQDCAQTSPLPPLSHNDEILMLGQKLGMAINELSINPFYIVYYVFIKRKHLASTVIYLWYTREKQSARSHIFQSCSTDTWA